MKRSMPHCVSSLLPLPTHRLPDSLNHPLALRPRTPLSIHPTPPPFTHPTPSHPISPHPSPSHPAPRLHHTTPSSTPITLIICFRPPRIPDSHRCSLVVVVTRRGRILIHPISPRSTITASVHTPPPVSRVIDDDIRRVGTAGVATPSAPSTARVVDDDVWRRAAAAGIHACYWDWGAGAAGLMALERRKGAVHWGVGVGRGCSVVGGDGEVEDVVHFCGVRVEGKG